MSNIAPNQTNPPQGSHRVNRNYKAGLFTHLFGEPENELELYNAFAKEPYPPGTPVTDLTLSDALFMDRINDLSFDIGGKLVVFFEHSSTINENIPLRYLTYCGRVYEKLVDKDAIFSEKRIPVPPPEFYVLYNGVKDFPEKVTYRLSDSYLQQPGGENSLELTVTAYNVNEGHNVDIVRRSENLHGYVTLVAKARAYEEGGMARPAAVEQAVKDCITEGILSAYLEKHASEVVNMLIRDWNWDTAKAVWQEEAKEEGRQEGRQEGREEDRMGAIRNAVINGFTIDDIVRMTGWPRDDVERLHSLCVSEDASEYQQQQP